MWLTKTCISFYNSEYLMGAYLNFLHALYDYQGINSNPNVSRPRCGNISVYLCTEDDNFIFIIFYLFSLLYLLSFFFLISSFLFYMYYFNLLKQVSKFVFYVFVLFRFKLFFVSSFASIFCTFWTYGTVSSLNNWQYKNTLFKEWDYSKILYKYY